MIGIDQFLKELIDTAYQYNLEEGRLKAWLQIQDILIRLTIFAHAVNDGEWRLIDIVKNAVKGSSSEYRSYCRRLWLNN